MNVKKLLLTRILPIILLITIGYGWWYTRPQQIINRRADSLIRFIEYKRLNLDNENTYTSEISNLFTNPLNLDFENTHHTHFTLPPGHYTHQDILEKLKELHQYTSSISVTQKSRTHHLDDGQATIELALEIKASAGQNFSKTNTYYLQLTLTEKYDWKINAIRSKEL